MKVRKLNSLLSLGTARAEIIAEELAVLLVPILEQAAREAARKFTQNATHYLTAAATGPGDVLRAAAHSPESTMVAVKPRPEEAERLAEASGEAPDTLHVTLAFLGKTQEGDLGPVEAALRAIAAQHAPLEGSVGGVGHFDDQGKGNPGIMLPDVPGLTELRQDVVKALAESGIDFGRDHGYQPHITITYGDHRVPDATAIGEPLHFDHLLIVRGDHPRPIPLTGVKPITAAGNEVPSWGSPAPNEVLDVDALVSKLRGKTDPVRLATIEAAMKPVLEGAGIAWDVTNPLVAKVLQQTGSQIVGIAETTQLNAMQIIRRSYEEGLSIPATAKAIQAGMTEASSARAVTIARTELVGAVNGGSLAAVSIVGDAAGISYWKVWMTAPGAQFPRHEDYDGLDGQTVSLDDVFDVGGAQLQFPGDPDGPADEVINCRCALGYTETPEGGDIVDAGDAESGIDTSAIEDSSLSDLAVLEAPEALADTSAPSADAMLEPVTVPGSPLEGPARHGAQWEIEQQQAVDWVRGSAPDATLAKTDVMTQIAAKLAKNDVFQEGLKAATQQEFTPLGDFKVGDKITFDIGGKNFEVLSGPHPFIDENAMKEAGWNALTVRDLQTGQEIELPEAIQGKLVPTDAHEFSLPQESYGSTQTEHTTSALVSKWAGTSADDDEWSLAVQRAVQEEFGLDPASINVFADRDVYAREEAEKIYADQGPALRAFVRAMYENTQEQLAAENIKEVTVYRGMKAPRGGIGGAAQTVMVKDKLELQPASSFSAHFGVAEGFAGQGGAIMAARIPAERILGSARTGFGCRGETEFVVLAGQNDTAWVNYIGDAWSSRPRDAEDFWDRARTVESGGVGVPETADLALKDVTDGSVVEVSGVTVYVLDAGDPEGFAVVSELSAGKVMHIDPSGLVAKPLYKVGKPSQAGKLPGGTFVNDKDPGKGLGGGGTWKVVDGVGGDPDKVFLEFVSWNGPGAAPFVPGMVESFTKEIKVWPLHPFEYKPPAVLS